MAWAQDVLAALVHVGTLQPEAGADRVDDARVDAAKVLVAESHALHDAGAEVVHHHVRRLHQAQRRRPVVLRLQVQGDAALVAVEAREDGVVAAVRVFADAPARQVAGAGPLDLDHVGAVVAQHLGAARAHHHLGEVEHPARRRVAVDGCRPLRRPPRSCNPDYRVHGRPARRFLQGQSPSGRLRHQGVVGRHGRPGQRPGRASASGSRRTSTRPEPGCPPSSASAAAMPVASPMAMQGGISRLTFWA